MDPKDIQTLRNQCEDIERPAIDKTINGDGSNIEDVKFSFDYIKQKLEEYGIKGTTYGSDLSSKIDTVNRFLTQVQEQLIKLSQQVREYADSRERENNRPS